MILDTKEAYCILKVLQILEKKKEKYSKMFKETKVSHTTLQGVLRDLVSKKFILKHDIGHQNVDYEITGKGKKLLGILEQLKDVLKD